jgi:hypothetical protein
MGNGAAAAGDRLHLAVAVLSLWLVATSPWLGMLRRIPAGAGWLDYAHVALGLATLPAGVAYAWICLREGRRGLYFPWSASGLRVVGRELTGLLRGRVPAAEGGGLIGFVEGLLLVALVAAAATGAGWFLAQGGDAALAWRAQHVVAARTLAGLLAAHVVTVSLHLLDFVRD